jgi:flavin-dependent dehydrogenase
MTRLFFLFLIALQLFSAAYSQQKAYDVVVYGATASGVMASVAASREGMKVLLVEPGKHVGGMVTGGLSHTDYGDRTVIGGLAMEFYKKVADHYTTHIFYWRGPEPHVGEKIMLDWLKASGVDLQFGKRVDKVVKEQGVINRRYLHR